MDLQQIPFKTDCSASTICIEWQEQEGHFDNYIVKFRVKNSKDVFGEQRTSESKLQVPNLKNGTLYEIKIYVEDTNGDESLLFKTEVRTDVSVASKLLKSAVKICNEPAIYRLRPVTITNPAEGIEFHEFFSEVSDDKEQSLLLLGASGSGKSTLVDAIINYVTDVSFADNFRFKITDEKNEISTTNYVEDIICYRIRCQDGFNVLFNINIIDVPGFHTGFNESIYKKLITLFYSVPQIGAACLVVPSFCRLDYDHRCIFNNILSIFGNDIGYVIPVITFDDGGEIQALGSLSEAKVPFVEHMHFTFNNSQLFSGYERVEVWNKRQIAMKNLFGEPSVFENCPSTKTKKVLESRISCSQALQKAKTLRQQIEHREKSIEVYEDKNSSQHRIQSMKRRDSDAEKICINCNMCNDTCVFNCSMKVRFVWYLVMFLEYSWSFICCICSCFKCCPRFCRCSCKQAYCCRIMCLQRLVGCTCGCSFVHHVKEYGRYSDKNDISEKGSDTETQNVFKIENYQEMQEMKNELHELINEFKTNYDDILKYSEFIKSTALLTKLPEEVENMKMYQEKL